MINNKDIDIVSDEISLYIESTEALIGSMLEVNFEKSMYFVEASKDKAADTKTKADKSVFDKIKDSIGKIIQKLKDFISSFFKKGQPVATYDKIEEIGKELDTPTIQGVNFGKVKVKLPNVYEYDTHLSNLILKSIAEISVKSYKEYSKKMRGSTKIDLLRESVDQVTRELRSYAIKSNNIKDEIKLLRKIEKKITPDLKANKKERKTAYNSVNDVTDKELGFFGKIKEKRELNKELNDVVDQTGSLIPVTEESVEDTYTEAGIPTAFIVVFMAPLATAAIVKLHSIIKELPSVIKSETISVTELYGRVKEINPANTERSLKNILDILNRTGGQESNINDFMASSSNLLEYTNKIQRLFMSYVKFKQAELDYYYKILNEIKTNLLAGITTGRVLTKESTEDNYIDLESFIESSVSKGDNNGHIND